MDQVLEFTLNVSSFYYYWKNYCNKVLISPKAIIHHCHLTEHLNRLLFLFFKATSYLRGYCHSGGNIVAPILCSWWTLIFIHLFNIFCLVRATKYKIQFSSVEDNAIKATFFYLKVKRKEIKKNCRFLLQFIEEVNFP